MAAPTTSMAFLLDLARCIGCQACAAACKTGNELAQDVQYIHLIEQTRGVFPNLQGGFKNHRCYHCTDAACVAVCPTGALYKQEGMTRLEPRQVQRLHLLRGRVPVRRAGHGGRTRQQVRRLRQRDGGRRHALVRQDLPQPCT